MIQLNRSIISGVLARGLAWGRIKTKPPRRELMTRTSASSIECGWPTSGGDRWPTPSPSRSICERSSAGSGIARSWRRPARSSRRSSTPGTLGPRHGGAGCRTSHVLSGGPRPRNSARRTRRNASRGPRRRRNLPGPSPSDDLEKALGERPHGAVLGPAGGLRGPSLPGDQRPAPGGRARG